MHPAFIRLGRMRIHRARFRTDRPALGTAALSEDLLLLFDFVHVLEDEFENTTSVPPSVKGRYVAPNSKKATGFCGLLVICITLFTAREVQLTQELKLSPVRITKGPFLVGNLSPILSCDHASVPVLGEPVTNIYTKQNAGGQIIIIVYGVVYIFSFTFQFHSLS